MNVKLSLFADLFKKITLNKKFMGKTKDGIHRITFVIDENGVIEEVIKKVDTKNHTSQIIEDI